MKRRKQIIWLAAAAVFVGTPLFFLLYFNPEAIGGGMMGDGDMKGMRGMMQRMMGDVLPPGIDPKLLPEPQSKGARLLTRYCAQCHNLSGPGMHTAEEWPAVIARMQERMNMHMQMMGGIVVPSAAELRTLTGYLQENALKPMDPKQFAVLNTPGGRAFRETCSQCHALPDPALHTLQEWPSVVARMQKNMAVMGKPVPDGPTLEKIIGFLGRHGRTSP